MSVKFNSRSISAFGARPSRSFPALLPRRGLYGAMSKCRSKKREKEEKDRGKKEGGSLMFARQ